MLVCARLGQLLCSRLVYAFASIVVVTERGLEKFRSLSDVRGFYYFVLCVLPTWRARVVYYTAFVEGAGVTSVFVASGPADGEDSYV